MAAQTAQQTSVLQKILKYFEEAAAIGMVVPEPHVEAISALIESLSQDLSQSALLSPHQALQAATHTAQVRATMNAQTVREMKAGTTVTSTF